MIAQRYFEFVGIPFRAGGRTRAGGVDCVGLVGVFFEEQLGLKLDLPNGERANARQGVDLQALLDTNGEARPGDVLFFRDSKRDEKIRHCAVLVEGGRVLHSCKSSGSRVDNDLRLLQRVGLELAGFIPADDVPRLCQALRDPALGEAATIITIVSLVISIGLAVASAAMAPKLSGNRRGRYSPDALVTQTSPELPLPDLLGKIVVAGNSAYTQLGDLGANVGSPNQQGFNKVIILGSGPFELIDHENTLRINNLSFQDKYWRDTSDLDGYQSEVAQSEAEAVTGSIGGKTFVPSFDLYDGAWATRVPVDVRASFDRDFPIYGFPGCAYVVFRAFNTSLYSGFNLTCRVKGRTCRTFDENGFIVTSVAAESLTGASKWTNQSVTADASTDRITLAAHFLENEDAVTFGGTAVPPGLTAAVTYYVAEKTTDDFKVSASPGGPTINLTGAGTAVTMSSTGRVRFKLAFDDIVDASALTVGGVAHTEMSATNQSGSVYSLNRLKGYIELLTAPAAGTALSIDYTYHPREWTQNPASLIVYLLTEKHRGKAFDESRIDWPAADAFRDHCDEDVTWNSANGTVTEDRYHADYAVDFRKPVQEHLRAILDACNGMLLLSDGRFVIRARKAESSVFSFTTANILAGSVTIDLNDRAERPNRVKATFHTEETHNAETEVIVEDVGDQEDRAAGFSDGVVDETLKFMSVTRSSQAERQALQFLADQVRSSYTVGFTTTIKGLALQPGDVVDITHPIKAAWSGKKFRIEALSHDEDDRLVLQASEYVDGAFI